MIYKCGKRKLVFAELALTQVFEERFYFNCRSVAVLAFDDPQKFRELNFARFVVIYQVYHVFNLMDVVCET